MDKITVLFPGGFKPLTGAHLELANRYAQAAEVEKVILLIGEKPRDGITREKTIQIFNLLNSNPQIVIQPTQFNSPIMAAYEYLFALPEDATGRFAMAASTKGDDYVRAKDFVPNVDKYATIGDKQGRTIPRGIDAIELSIDIDPLLYSNGEPISASTIRAALANDDYTTFRASYPMQSDAEVKNVWQILKGVQETSIFSTEWWTSSLTEDVNDVVEAIMNPKEKNRHDSKIKQLRAFLEKHRGQEFVYDFDRFTKTVAGVKLIENVLAENYITRDELKQIEPVIDRFFKRFGIDVDFQGKFTHFIERLNDPRNEGTIRLDDLENLFKDLSDEYGQEIVRQFQQNKPTAITSDYQFDVPIHMPFQLEFDRSLGQIKLIPRTIKAQRKPWQANDPADVIYKIESVMPRSNNRIQCDNCPHSWPTKTGGKDLYVCHECGHDNNPALKESKILTEGGAAGHMAHPWDDHGLTFNDMKEIVSRGLSGQLDIEQAVTEKTDGQNIQITWKNGEIGFARNKGTIINPMTTPEIIADFLRKQQKAIDERGAAAGEDYQRVVDAYQACAEDLTESLRSIPEATLNEIFKNGRVFANMEIIYPATKNVIAYDKAHLQFHNLVEYDENGNTVETDLTGGAMMQRVIQDANAHMQKTFSFIPPQRIKLGRVYDFEDQQAAFFNEIAQLQRQFNLKDTDMISEYHKAWWRDAISSKAQQLGYDVPEDILITLIYRWSFGDKSKNISVLKKEIGNPEFSAWVGEFDKKDFKQYKKQNLEPFESIFLRLGVVVLKNAENFLAANPDKTVQEIKTELAELIKDLQAKNDPATIQKLELELRRIQKLGGFDSIVPTEGVVFTFQGNTYKMTGAFAPVNQLLGVLKYAR
jgi:hypothetical protein